MPTHNGQAGGLAFLGREAARSYSLIFGSLLAVAVLESAFVVV
jgi:hypothetical protein